MQGTRVVAVVWVDLERVRQALRRICAVAKPALPAVRITLCRRIDLALIGILNAPHQVVVTPVVQQHSQDVQMASLVPPPPLPSAPLPSALLSPTIRHRLRPPTGDTTAASVSSTTGLRAVGRQ